MTIATYGPKIVDSSTPTAHSTDEAAFSIGADIGGRAHAGVVGTALARSRLGGSATVIHDRGVGEIAPFLWYGKEIIC